MSQEEKPDKKPAADDLAEIFRAFGQAISEVFDDPEPKRKVKELADSATDSAKTLANRFKDEDVKAKFRDVGKAAEAFGKSVADDFKIKKKEYLWWQRLDLNQRPRAYESPALPLSYAAKR